MTHDRLQELASSSVQLTEILEQLRGAGLALNQAERYRVSKRQGERHSVPVYVRRGMEYMAAVALLDQYVTASQPRRTVT